MIRISRPPLETIPELGAWRYVAAKSTAVLAAYHQRGDRRGLNFKPAIWHQARSVLVKVFRSKCAACESRLGVNTFVSVAHFRPKSVVVEDKSSPGYWWLAYDWDNLFILCPRCNQMKGARFPIPINATRALSPGDNLSNERPLLLNPCVENPNAHLAFDDSGLVVGQTERGRITIEIYGLNREELVAARRLAIANKLDLWKVSLNEIRRSDQTAVDRLAVGEDVEYAAALRAASHRFVLENERALMHSAVGRRFIGRAKKARPIGHEQIERLASAAKRKEVAYSVESAADTDSAAFLAARRRIERIEIRDFRSIKELSIRFPVPQSEDEAWLMLLGENATGKSSVLQAVALALMGSTHANALGLDAKSFLRHNAESREGSVEVHLTNLNDPVRMTFGKDVDGFQVTPAEPKVLLLGYGATRLLPRPGLGASDENKYIRIKNLFDPTAPLNDAEAWLSDKTKVSQEKFEEVAEALREALLLPRTVTADRERGYVEFVHPDDRLRLSDLSDGYQSVIAMVADIAFCVFEKWGSIKEAEAIVLLDEIEVHLHPRWKMTIVERLRRCFPRLSFITTTHDPLCLRGLHKTEIMVLRRADSGALDTLTDFPDLDGYRADQLLTSPLFDLVTTRGPRTEEDRARYGVLLEKKRRSPAEEAEYLELEAKLGALSIDETVRPDGAAARIDDVNLDAAVQQITAGLSEEIRRQIAKVLAPAEDAK